MTEISRDQFDVGEQVIDDDTRVVDVRGTIDAVRVASVLEAVAADPAGDLVLDLTGASVARPDDLRALAGGLIRLRRGAPVALVSTDPEIAGLVATMGLDGIIDVVESQVVARAAMIVERSTDPAPAQRPARPVRLESLDGVACVRVHDHDGTLLLEAPAARWEVRPSAEGTQLAYRYGGTGAILALVLSDGAEERAAFDAHLVRGVERWIGDDGTVGATVTLVD